MPHESTACYAVKDSSIPSRNLEPSEPTNAGSGGIITASGNATKVVGQRWLIIILDGHSRYVTGSQIFKDGTAENVIWLLNHAIHEYARPREILTDHGSQFWSVHRGESSFDAYCERNRIKQSSAASVSLRRLERLRDGSEPTT